MSNLSGRRNRYNFQPTFGSCYHNLYLDHNAGSRGYSLYHSQLFTTISRLRGRNTDPTQLHLAQPLSFGKSGLVLAGASPDLVILNNDNICVYFTEIIVTYILCRSRFLVGGGKRQTGGPISRPSEPWQVALFISLYLIIYRSQVGYLRPV